MPKDHSKCVFCLIASGQIGAQAVYSDNRLFAFLDRGPIRPGHVQIIPREHFDYFDNLPPDLAGQIVQLGQRIARAQKKLYGVQRVSFLFTGGDIAHVHAHVVPMVEHTDITSRRYIQQEHITFASLPTPPHAEMEATASALRELL